MPAALRLAAEVARLNRVNRDLERRIRELIYRATRAEQDAEQAHAAFQRVCRDADLIACMAKDPKTALAVLRDLHRIDQLPESKETA